MIKKALASLSCAILLSSTLNAKDLKLEDLINIALQNNTNIQNSIENKNINKEQITKSKASYLPSLSLSADVGKYDIENQKDEASSIAINANQLIYDFGATTNSIKASKSNYEASKNTLIETKASTILNVKEVYYEILNKYQQIEVAKEALKLDTLQLKQAKEYFKAGVRTQIDVTNAKLKLSNSNLKLVQAKYGLKTTTTKLLSLLGKNLSEEVNIKKDDEDITVLAKNIQFSNEDLTKHIKNGLENRKVLNEKKDLIQAQKASLKAVNAQYLPRIDLNASYSDKNSDEINSLDINQSAVTLNLKWDFFTGFSTKASKKIELAKLKTSKENLKQQELEVIQDITSSFYDLKQSIDSLKIGLLNVELATKNLNLANERYKAGLNDLIELNDAKLEYTQAKSDLVNTYYNYLINIAKLQYARGD